MRCYVNVKRLFIITGMVFYHDLRPKRLHSILNYNFLIRFIIVISIAVVHVAAAAAAVPRVLMAIIFSFSFAEQKNGNC